MVRHIDLELLSFQQLDEVQHEIKISQLLHHQNIACYLTSFVVDAHLWAVQPLMHYGEHCVTTKYSDAYATYIFNTSFCTRIYSGTSCTYMYMYVYVY